MILRLFFVLSVPLMLFAAQLQNFNWADGETLLTFLERNKMPQSIYYELDKEDQKLAEEIISGVGYQVLVDGNDTIAQVLIPVNDELQLHIFKNAAGAYVLEPKPIISEIRREAFVLSIESSPYNDIIKATGSKRLAQSFINGFKNSLNFRTDLRKGDRLVMVYDQQYRMGQPFSMPILQVAMIEMRNKRHYVYLHTDERYYDANGNEVEGFLLGAPVRNARMSSGFTKRRFHPILKKYRAHLGVDFAARTGTPIMAAGGGRVVFAGYSDGYGNVVKIQHSDGYMTLYAHQKSFRRGIKRGVNVKQGQVIGYVGSSGLSSGPHLHFGLYKNGRAINPSSAIKVTTRKLAGEQKKAFEQVKANFNQTVELYLEAGKAPEKMAFVESVCYADAQTCQQIELTEGTFNETL